MKPALISIAALLLTACGEPVTVATQDGNATMLIFTDDLNGCQYLYAYNVGLTPRIGPDGKPVCSPTEPSE